MHTQFAGRRHATAAAIFALVLSFGHAQAANEKLAVEVSSVGENTLRAVLEDAPLTIVRTGPTTIIETNTAGYKRLMAESSLTLVRLIGGANATALAAQRRGADATDAVAFVVRLRTVSLQSGPGAAIEAAAAQNANHSAQIVSRRRTREALPPLGELGPGQLLVRGLDASGAEVTRAVIQDPRLVRYEAVGPDNKQLTGRRDFLRTAIELHVTMPFDARVTMLSIVAEAGAGEKELARVSAR